MTDTLIDEYWHIRNDVEGSPEGDPRAFMTRLNDQEPNHALTYEQMEEQIKNHLRWRFAEERYRLPSEDALFACFPTTLESMAVPHSDQHFMTLFMAFDQITVLAIELFRSLHREEELNRRVDFIESKLGIAAAALGVNFPGKDEA